MTITDKHGLIDPNIFTDAQLRAECVRRKMEMDPWLDAATSDELRAECERRGLHGQELDGWQNAIARLTGERDEWKRRAEEAEAHLHDPRRCIRIMAADGVSLVDLGSVHDCGRIELIVSRVDGERLPMRDLLLSGAEATTGIAAHRPDNSVAHLDEDLLCDDA